MHTHIILIYIRICIHVYNIYTYMYVYICIQTMCTNNQRADLILCSREGRGGERPPPPHPPPSSVSRFFFFKHLCVYMYILCVCEREKGYIHRYRNMSADKKKHI